MSETSSSIFGKKNIQQSFLPKPDRSVAKLTDFKRTPITPTRTQQSFWPLKDEGVTFDTNIPQSNIQQRYRGDVKMGEIVGPVASGIGVPRSGLVKDIPAINKSFEEVQATKELINLERKSADWARRGYSDFPRVERHARNIGVHKAYQKEAMKALGKGLVKRIPQVITAVESPGNPSMVPMIRLTENVLYSVINRDRYDPPVSFQLGPSVQDITRRPNVQSIEELGSRSTTPTRAQQSFWPPKGEGFTVEPQQSFLPKPDRSVAKLTDFKRTPITPTRAQQSFWHPKDEGFIVEPQQSFLPKPDYGVSKFTDLKLGPQSRPPEYPWK